MPGNPDVPAKKFGGRTRSTRHGNGSLWGKGEGGPAKGAAQARGDMAAAFKPGNAAAVGRKTPSEDDKDTAAAIKARWAKMALDDETPPLAALKAGDQWMDRYQGKPAQAVIELGRDDLSRMQEDELRRIATSLGIDPDAVGGSDQGSAGVAASHLPPKLGGILH